MAKIRYVQKAVWESFKKKFQKWISCTDSPRNFTVTSYEINEPKELTLQRLPSNTLFNYYCDTKSVRKTSGNQICDKIVDLNTSPPFEVLRNSIHTLRQQHMQELKSRLPSKLNSFHESAAKMFVNRQRSLSAASYQIDSSKNYLENVSILIRDCAPEVRSTLSIRNNLDYDFAHNISKLSNGVKHQFDFNQYKSVKCSIKDDLLDINLAKKFITVFNANPNASSKKDDDKKKTHQLKNDPVSRILSTKDLENNSNTNVLISGSEPTKRKKDKDEELKLNTKHSDMKQLAVNTGKMMNQIRRYSSPHKSNLPNTNSITNFRNYLKGNSENSTDKIFDKIDKTPTKIYTYKPIKKIIDQIKLSAGNSSKNYKSSWIRRNDFLRKYVVDYENEFLFKPVTAH